MLVRCALLKTTSSFQWQFLPLKLILYLLWIEKALSTYWRLSTFKCLQFEWHKEPLLHTIQVQVKLYFLQYNLMNFCELSTLFQTNNDTLLPIFIEIFDRRLALCTHVTVKKKGTHLKGTSGCQKKMYDILNLSLTWDFSTFCAFCTFVLFQQWKVLTCTKDKSTTLSHLLYFLFKKVCTIIFREYVVLNLKISKAEGKTHSIYSTHFFFSSQRSFWIEAAGLMRCQWNWSKFCSIRVENDEKSCSCTYCFTEKAVPP